MLKKLIVTMALVGVTAASYGQGQVNFNTQTVGAQIKDSKGVVPTVGTAYFAQLYAAAGAGAAVTALQKVGNPVNLRGGGNIGYVQVSGTTSKGVEVNPVVDVPSTGPGGPSTVQVRAWSSSVDTYEAAVGKGGLEWGSSAPLSLTATGNPAASPPTTPVDLVGLQGFQLQTVPEPSTIALGVLGAASLFFARRRK
jgi:hypothetical protein